VAEQQILDLSTEPRLAPSGTAKSDTRLIVMGSPALVEGFALIGFETWPNATIKDVESLLAELERGQEKALIFLEPMLSRCQSAQLSRVRAESARIIVTEVPPLHAPGDYHPAVEDLVIKVLGPDALEEKA
jgi:vacuolar-type H+-ATPase subunit F/Vma7